MERIMVGVKLEDSRMKCVFDIKPTKRTWASRVMRRTGNRWSLRATGWIPREGKKRRGQQRVRYQEVRRQKNRTSSRETGIIGRGLRCAIKIV